MPLTLDTLLEGSPAYGVVDARDGVVLFRRPGHEAAFDALATQVLEASDLDFEVIPLTDEAEHCDRLFVAPLAEPKSFDPR
ncbi:MAG: hypothetical protein ACOH1E_01715 [Brevundimonas sp.]